MVQARQKNFRAFVFTEGEAQETIAYIEKNFVLLKNFLMVFAYPIQSDSAHLLYDYLVSKNLNFIESLETREGNAKGQIHLNMEDSNTKPAMQNVPQVLESQNIETKEEKTPSTLVLHRMIRSGEEIITQGDLTIFGRVNSGAHIQSEGNVQIFGEINGNVLCNGDYMILGKVSEGNIVFGGEILDKELLQNNKNKIYKTQNKITIKELQ